MQDAKLVRRKLEKKQKSEERLASTIGYSSRLRLTDSDSNGNIDLGEYHRKWKVSENDQRDLP